MRKTCVLSLIVLVLLSRLRWPIADAGVAAHADVAVRRFLRTAA